MGNELQLVIHGRGNAWPVVLGETHPFYDRNDPRDLSNASFSLVQRTDGRIQSDILVDAGHGTIQSLITGSNRIPDCICLTHGHMDHTLSVDWVVQSYWKKHQKQKRYPIYSTAPVFEFLLQSYPHLEGLTEFRELLPGIAVTPDQASAFTLTSYPVYHGQSAVGASMLVVETEGKRVLFTGDLLSPLLRKEDYDHLKGLDVLVVDTNNRFPWPRTNHWSFSGDTEDPWSRSVELLQYLDTLSWEVVGAPHQLEKACRSTQSYFQQLRDEGAPEEGPCTIMEFMQNTVPKKVIPVHYSGIEDAKYHNQGILAADQLGSWIAETAESAGIRSTFVIPETSQVIPI